MRTGLCLGALGSNMMRTILLRVAMVDRMSGGIFTLHGSRTNIKVVSIGQGVHLERFSETEGMVFENV